MTVCVGPYRMKCGEETLIFPISSDRELCQEGGGGGGGGEARERR